MKARVFHKKLPEVLDYALGIVISSIPGMRNKNCLIAGINKKLRNDGIAEIILQFIIKFDQRTDLFAFTLHNNKI